MASPDQAEKTFVYEVPADVHPWGFVQGMENLLPGSVVSREGNRVTLRDIGTGATNTRAFIKLVVDPPQSIGGEGGDCGVDTGDI